MRSYEEIKERGKLWNVNPVPYVGMSGYIKLPDCKTCSVVWTRDESGLEHVSVSLRHIYNIPSWDDMCKLKEVFFDDEEEVYQIHPKKKQICKYPRKLLALVETDKWRLEPSTVKKGEHQNEYAGRCCIDRKRAVRYDAERC